MSDAATTEIFTPSSPLVTLGYVVEFMRKQKPDDPHALHFGRQDYLVRVEGARSRGDYFHGVTIDWNQISAELETLLTTASNSEARQRMGIWLRKLVDSANWGRHEAHLLDALDRQASVHLTIRSSAPEIYLLPWELVTIEQTAQHLMELKGVTIGYAWPGTSTVAWDYASGHALVAWSAAGGSVPAAELQRALAKHFPVSTLSCLPDATAESLEQSLQEALQSQPVSILVLLAHTGTKDHRVGLSFGHPNGQDIILPSRLRALLSPFTTMLRMVVVCACGSGDIAPLRNSSGSIIQSLHRIGIPWVVGSRHRISKRGAIILLDSLMKGLIEDKLPVEESVGAARRALLISEGYGPWMGLQLYARHEDRNRRVLHDLASHEDEPGATGIPCTIDSRLKDSLPNILRTYSMLTGASEDLLNFAKEVLREFGFTRIHRELSVFGYDYTAFYASPDCRTLKWYISFYPAASPLRADYLAEKLLWTAGELDISGGYVIVTAADLTGEATDLIKRYKGLPVLVWTGLDLARLIAVCPDTCARWFDKIEPLGSSSISEQRSLLVPPIDLAVQQRSGHLSISLRHEHTPPSRVAYFYQDEMLEKWNTDHWHVHLLSIRNMTGTTIIIHSIRVETFTYNPLPRRILVQRKAKGLYQPVRLEYTPIPEAGASLEILAPKVLSIPSKEPEIVRLELGSGLIPGLYEIGIVIGYQFSGRFLATKPKMIRFCACSESMEDEMENRLTLASWRKHYDVLAAKVLELSEEDWRLMNSAHSPDHIVYVGPNIWDEVFGRQHGWCVQRTRLGPIKKKGGRTILDNSEMILDLGLVPGETLPLDMTSRVLRNRRILGEVFDLDEQQIENVEDSLLGHPATVSSKQKRFASEARKRRQRPKRKTKRRKSKKKR